MDGGVGRDHEMRTPGAVMRWEKGGPGQIPGGEWGVLHAGGAGKLAGGGMLVSRTVGLAIQSIRARVVAFLDAHYRDMSLTPEKIAAGCGISRSYLYKAFSDGETVMERLKRRRLSAARGMIENNAANRSLTQIAYACGFSSSSEFSKQFKSSFGISPSKL